MGTKWVTNFAPDLTTRSLWFESTTLERTGLEPVTQLVESPRAVPTRAKPAQMSLFRRLCSV
jgi:hypothetical protein